MERYFPYKESWESILRKGAWDNEEKPGFPLLILCLWHLSCGERAVWVLRAVGSHFSSSCGSNSLLLSITYVTMLWYFFSFTHCYRTLFISILDEWIKVWNTQLQQQLSWIKICEFIDSFPIFKAPIHMWPDLILTRTMYLAQQALGFSLGTWED